MRTTRRRRRMTTTTTTTRTTRTRRRTMTTTMRMRKKIGQISAVCSKLHPQRVAGPMLRLHRMDRLRVLSSLTSERADMSVKRVRGEREERKRSVYPFAWQIYSNLNDSFVIVRVSGQINDGCRVSHTFFILDVDIFHFRCFSRLERQSIYIGIQKLVRRKRINV